jgi:hypothetical protein
VTGGTLPLVGVRGFKAGEVAVRRRGGAGIHGRVGVGVGWFAPGRVATRGG